MTDAIADIHDFWFGEIKADGLPGGEQGRLWFIKKAATDTLITKRYADLLAQAAQGELVDEVRSGRRILLLWIQRSSAR